MSRLFQLNETTWVDPAEVATVMVESYPGAAQSGSAHYLYVTLRPGNHVTKLTFEYTAAADAKAAARILVAVCNKTHSDGDDDEIDS